MDDYKKILGSSPNDLNIPLKSKQNQMKEQTISLLCLKGTINLV